MTTQSEDHVLIIATSLNPESRSLVLAKRARDRLTNRGVGSTLHNLREFNLPLCDGTRRADKEPNVLRLHEETHRATHVLFALPIYNYAVNAAAKNVVEFLSYENNGPKTVGFLCAAGGQNSYLSILPFANSIWIELGWWIAPGFVYVGKDGLDDPKTQERIDRLIDNLLNGPNQVRKTAS